MTRTMSELTLENILLGLLREQPRHGYALFKRVESSPELSRIWHIKRSKLYYLLERLEEKGYLSSHLERVPSQPDRKMYTITEEGEQAFEAWVRSPVKSGRHMRIAFLSRLYFALEEGESLALELVADQTQRCRSWKENLEEQLRGMETSDFITQQIFHFRIGQVEAMLDWLRECQHEIEQQHTV